MCKHSKVHSLQCVLPPYIVEKILESGDPKLLRLATLTRYRDHRFRSDRNFFAMVSSEERSILLEEEEQVDERGTIAAKTPRRVVYTAKNQTQLPGTIIRRENTQDTGDEDVDRVYDAAGHTWHFYYDLFGRNSINRRGMILRQTVHYGENYANAFWNGKQMVYGEGDGEVFGSFTGDIDVIGHELTHGVVQYEANLEYRFQSGALNESMADIFGIMIKQRAMNEDVNKSDWLIGKNIIMGDEYALRSLKAPGTAYRNHPLIGTDPQPATMKDYKNLNAWQDNGGVHINSGIPNFAFYVTCKNLGGFSWEKAGRIWYEALCNRNLMNSTSQFADAKAATITTAGRLFGSGSLEEKAVIAGWNEAQVL